MANVSFDAWLRARAAESSRRGFLGGLVLGGPLAVLGVGQTQARRKKKRKKRRDAAGSPTCAERCGGTCTQCFRRPGGATICGFGWGPRTCQQCTTDTDCLGTAHPYCTVSKTNRFEESSRWTECEPYPVGVCTQIIACP